MITSNKIAAIKKVLPLLICLLLGACNLPAADDSDLNVEAATIVAMTLTAGNTPAPEKTPPLPTHTPTRSETGTATSTTTPTITPTYSVPMLTVNEPTNCRKGPGQSFDVVFTLLTGASVEIVGRYPVNNYWIVKVQGINDPCWVWGDYSTASGSYWTVPSMTPPPTTAPQPAGKPTNLNYSYTCTFNGVNSDVTVTLKWNDNANDELGYRIYRDDARVAELPANSNTYTETVAADATQKLSYGVSAYNAAGESDRSTISFSCQ